MEPSCSTSNVSDGDPMENLGGKSRLIEVLDVRLVEIRDLKVGHYPLTSAASSSTSSSSDKRVCCVVKLDHEEIFRSSSVARTQNPYFADDLHHEVKKNFSCLFVYVYDQIPNRVARPIARITLRKQDLVKYSGLDRWWRLKPMNRQSDVTGKVCLEITRTWPNPTMATTASGTTAIYDSIDQQSQGQTLSVRILDYCDLNHARSNDLFSVVNLDYPDRTADTKKLRMRRKHPPPPPGNNQQNPASSASSASGSSTAALCSQDAATFVLRDYGVPSPPPQQVDEAYVESATLSCSKAAPVLRVSVWHDILSSFSSYFHGEVRIPIDSSLNAQLNNNVSDQQQNQSFRAWYSLTPRNGTSNNNNNTKSQSNQNTSSSTSTDQQNESGTMPSDSSFLSSKNNNGSSTKGSSDHLGSLRLKINYSVDHILPTKCYTVLWSNLLDALTVQPFRCSIAGLMAALPRTELEQVAKPLVRIFLHSDHITEFIQVLCTEEIAQCQDVNALFRSSSLASKCIYELMKLVGQQYLISTLKPVLDKIYAERRCCEIDPDKLKPSGKVDEEALKDMVAENAVHLHLYTEMALSRICDSSHRCPPLLKEVFRILRETTHRYHPDNPAIQLLVLSSFLIMRFFAIALLNPKLFMLKRENNEPNVQRTLVLISKIIQRLNNYVVVGHNLTEKEPYLTPIMAQFSDVPHRLGFTKFFDRVSCAGGENSITGESITVLKEGVLVERIPKKNKKNLQSSSSFSDQSSISSASSSSASSLCFNFRNYLPKATSKPRFCVLTETDFSWYKEKGQTLVGRISLADVKEVQTAEELFNNPLVLEISSDRHRVYLEASNQVELTEWIVTLQRASTCQRRTQNELRDNAAKMYQIDLSQQLENVHMIFMDNYEVMKAWKDHLTNATPLEEKTPTYEKHLVTVDASGRATFQSSIDRAMECVESLERVHIEHFRQIQYGSKDMPIGEDNYLLLGSRIERVREYATVFAGGSNECAVGQQHQQQATESAAASSASATTSRSASADPPVPYSLMADMEKAWKLGGGGGGGGVGGSSAGGSSAVGPPLPPKPVAMVTTTAILHHTAD